MTAGSYQILPWVVGIRGLIEERSIHVAVEYLDVSRSEWAAAVACTIVASVQSPAFMRRVRFSSNNQSRDFDTNDPVPAPSGAENRSISKKRQFSSSRLSDPSATQAKWKRMATNTAVAMDSNLLTPLSPVLLFYRLFPLSPPPPSLPRPYPPPPYPNLPPTPTRPTTIMQPHPYPKQNPCLFIC